MDLLDWVIWPGSDLLAQVDVMLTRFGAPAGHPVWGEISRAGTLPSAALDQVAALAPAEMRSLAAELVGIASGVRTVADSVPASFESRGQAADGFANSWRELSAQIGSGPATSSLAERIAETAAELDEIADWAAAARHDLAGEIGGCIGSSEAVLVRAAGGDPRDDAIRAAADIAACVLGSFNRAVGDGWQHVGRRRGLDVETAVTAAQATLPPPANHIELH